MNPFIGTEGFGHTFPGATTPFGFVQLSPETGNVGWEYCSGYQYSDTVLHGFAHTHLNGTGWMDLGDVLMLPITNGSTRINYTARMDKSRESARPGYYSVFLPEDKVFVELTATERTGVHRYTYQGEDTAQILVDIHNGIVGKEEDHLKYVLASEIQIDNKTTLSGFIHTKHWVERKVFFVIEFSKPFRKATFRDQKSKGRLIVDFGSKGPVVVEARVGLSTVSIPGAGTNLSESKNKSFESIRSRADEKWNQYLEKILVEGSDEDKIKFYTSMYHLFIQPNNIADADGKYTGPDGKVHRSANKTYYSTLSIWDTYRAAHPLYSILVPEKNAEMITTMLDHFDAVGMLPIWTLWGKENFCMIGNHAVPILTDAYFKGILKKEDRQRVYPAVKTSLTKNSWYKYNWNLYDKYGFLPADTITYESVSRTLEATTDDWCAAQLARSSGKMDDFDFFNRRAGYYKNLYDRKSELMRGRKRDSTWVTPFDPIEISPGGGTIGEYTEGNAWQYFWHVQHDVDGLIGLTGGREAFERKLDMLFTMNSDVYSREGSVADVTGLIGQYAHGNEPSHHVAYLYNYAGAPWKTQEIVPRILKSQYRNAPNGLSGNDDCGQMSAWYIFSTLGFYPVNPASGVFEIGVPAFKHSEIVVNGKRFVIQAQGLSDVNRYIQTLELNGKPWNSFQISYKDIMKGGTLKVSMGPVPKRTP